MQRTTMLARVRDLLADGGSIDMSAGELADEIDATPVEVGSAFASPVFLDQLRSAGYEADVTQDAGEGRTLIQIRPAR